MTHFSFSAFISTLKRRDHAAQGRAKIEQVFQRYNQVRRVGSDEVFTVYEVDYDGAYLMSDRDQVVKPTWLTTDGRFRPEVAARWELAPTAPRIEPAVLAAEGRYNPAYVAGLAIPY